MNTFLMLLCVLSLMAGALIMSAAQSAIHEIEAFMLFLISAVLLVGSAVVDAIKVARKAYETPEK